MNDTQSLLGKVLNGPQERDAIHIAVAPVVAARNLQPGDNIGFLPNGKVSITADKHIGIVDSFLSRGVVEGEQFWMFLYPNTITGLRHGWTHPAFPAGNTASSTDKGASEAWLRDFCAKADCPGYEATIATALDNSDTWDDDYLHFIGRNAHGDIPPEFWDHVEVVTGQKITQRPTKFSCSC